jgi:hypothetical protein
MSQIKKRSLKEPRLTYDLLYYSFLISFSVTHFSP